MSTVSVLLYAAVFCLGFYAGRRLVGMYRKKLIRMHTAIDSTDQ